MRRRGGDSCGHSRRSEGTWPGQDHWLASAEKATDLCAIKLDD